ncbi:MAG: Imm5 family immunity protein [Acidimicrobiales bacterium]
MSADLPEGLRRALRDAEVDLARSEHGELSLIHRRRLWEALGDEGGLRGSPGHRRRTNLDLLTVEGVKPIWEMTYPSDPAVDDVLAAAREVLDGKQTTAWADDRQSRAQVAFQNRMSADRQFAAGYVGNAATTALSTATRDKGYADLAPEVDDYDLDPWDWDTSFIAAMAAAGGEVGDPAASDERRRQFWEWYLREAVPTAWRSAG